MPGDPVVVVFILIIGCAAFLFGVLYVFGRVIGAVGHSVASIMKGRPGKAPPSRPPGGETLICSREQCRKIEYRNGRFCSQCGAPLNKPPPGNHA